jgi:DNA-binding IclR family transcriptional regulator
MDAFLDALGGKASGKGHSVSDLCEKLGMGESATRKKLGELVRAGKARHVGFREGTNMIGRTCQTPVYQIVK